MGKSYASQYANFGWLPENFAFTPLIVLFDMKI